MLPGSRDLGGLYLSYRNELLVKGKATGALKYSVNMARPWERNHVDTPALTVRYNKFGVRGLFAGTDLPKGYKIFFDGQYFQEGEERGKWSDDPYVGVKNFNVGGDTITKDNESITKLFDIELKVVHIRCTFFSETSDMHNF